MKKTLLIFVLIFISVTAFSQVQMGTNFDIFVHLPIDTRLAVEDTNLRNALLWRYEGLQCYVEFDSNTYQLQGGVANSDWVIMAGAGGSDNNVFEKELTDSETNIAVGYTINTTSLIFLNGTSVKTEQWSGEGTETLILALDIRQYDNLLIRK